MVQAWRMVRVFISSTFRDMNAERDYLVRVVFPELKERCRERHVQVVDVDLRWGVTEEQAEGGGALDICLDEIDSCRPYFLGLLGHRYGYIPPGHDQSITAHEIYHGVLHNNLPRQLMDLRPFVEGILEGRALFKEQVSCLVHSYHWNHEKGKYLLQQDITPEDQKTLRSIFDVYSIYQKDRSFFFFRSESLTRKLAGSDIKDYFEVDEDRKSKLEVLKQEIINTKLPHFEYDNLETFGHKVLETLWKCIDAEFPEEREEIERDWLKEEAEFHELFMADRTRRFVGRSDILNKMHAFVEDDAEPRLMVVTGEPGCGKSALMARYTDEVAHQHPEWLILSHFVGASPSSTSLRRTLRRLCTQISLSCDFETQKREKLSCITGTDEEAGKQRDAVEKEFSIPEEYQQITGTFHRFIEKAAELKKVLIAIDALNQFERTDNSHTMMWMPQKLPANVKVVVSTLAGDVLDALRAWRIKPRFEETTGLTEPEIKEFVTNYLNEIRKEFPTAKIRADFYNKIKAGNPLHILTALEEIRVFPFYKELGKRVASLPDNVPELFDQVLERVEGDFSRPLVRGFMSLIACGRQGVTGADLQMLLREYTPIIDNNKPSAKLPDMLFQRLRRAFSAYLFERSGVIDFFHGQLKEAVGRRYLAKETDRDKTHQIIADYFEKRWAEPYLRALDELPHQLTNAKNWVGMERTLCDLHFIEAKCAAGMTYDLIHDYDDALDALPDSVEEKQERQKHEACVKKYIEDLIAYAKGEIDRLDVIPSVGPWSYEKVRRHTERIINNPSRLDRIRAFSLFVNSQTYALVKYASQRGFVVQQAYNSSRSGPIASAADHIINTGMNEIILLKHQEVRPHYNLHPGKLAIIEVPYGTGISITPDGRKACGSYSDHLKVWDLHSGECLRTFNGHSDDIYIACTCMTPDGRFAVSGNSDGTLKIWDLENEECIKTLEGHKDSVGCVCVTPDGRLAVSGSTDKTVKVWDLESGECLRTIENVEEYFQNNLAVTTNGKRVLTTKWDYSIGVWDIDIGECISTLRGHSEAVTSISVTPDGSKSISASVDKTLKVWDLQKGQCIKTLEGHNDLVRCVCMTPDGRLAASISDDKTLKVWDLERGECIRTLEASGDSVVVTADGKRAVSRDDTYITAWDIESGESLIEPEKHSKNIDALGITHDGRKVLSLSQNTVKVWDLVNWNSLQIPKGYKNLIDILSITKDGRRSISADTHDKLKIWNLETGECLSTLSKDAFQKDKMDITPDGKRAVIAVNHYPKSCETTMIRRTLRVWDLENGECLRSLEGTTNIVQPMYISPNCETAISFSAKYITDNKKSEATDDDSSQDEYDIKFWIWDLKSGGYHGAEDVYKDDEISVEMTISGKRAISKLGEFGRTLRVWDIESGECLSTLKGHSAAVSRICITPNGTKAVSASQDKTIKVWNLDTGECLRTLLGHSDAVMCVSVTPDGKQAISASHDGSLKVWDLETGECLKTLQDNYFHWVINIGISPDGKKAVLQSYSNSLLVWDLESGAGLYELLENCDNPYYCSWTISPDSKRVISVAKDNSSLYLWDIESGQWIRTLETTSNGFVQSMAISQDGGTLISLHAEMADWSRDVGKEDEINAKAGVYGLGVFELESGECLAEITGHNGSVDFVRILPDGRKVISAGWDKTLKLWDLEIGECIRTFEGHKDVISGVGISPEGKRAVSLSDDNSIKVWDLESGQCLRTFEVLSDEGCPSQYYGEIFFTPDGRRLIVGCLDNNRNYLVPAFLIRVWDLETGKCLNVLKGHGQQENIEGLSITPDGKMLISGSGDSILCLWDLDTGECLAIYPMTPYSVSTSKIRAEGWFMICTTYGDVVPITISNCILGPPIVTPVRIWIYETHGEGGYWDTDIKATCPWCNGSFALSNESILAIRSIARNTNGLPDESSGTEGAPRLQAECPYCHKTMRFTPFVVDNKPI